MSEKIDKFIRQHKDYFQRNKEYLELNDWHVKQPVQMVENEEGEMIEEETGITSRRRKSILKEEDELVGNILSRLKAFLKVAEGDRHLKKVKDFIQETTDIIYFFIYKCDYYIDDNPIADIEGDLQRSYEISFQDDIFNYKIKIDDELSKLNLDEDVDAKDIKFFKDAKASLALKEPLTSRVEDVRILTDKIPIDWNIATSKQMYINMNPKDIPKWNTKKHYFEQDPVVLQFWAEEFNKIRKGVTIAGYWIHPWLYFHLNFFRTRIPQPNGEQPNIQPDLRDNEWFFVENLKNCVSKKYPDFYEKAMLVYGTRRFGKSVIMASLAHWRTLTVYNASGTIVGGSSSDLAALTNKIKTSLDNIEPAFKLDINRQNWENGETFFGIKQDQSTNINYSSIIVQNLEGGTKKKTQKTAGLDPSVSMYDEIGKYEFLKPYLAALPSFATPYGFKCITVLAGTGGEADLSRDAMTVLGNPEAYDLLPMNWDLLESKIDPDQITWKRRVFATYFPGQMAYEKGFIKEPKKFSEFLELESKELDKIEISLTNWEKNTAYLNKKLEEAKKQKGSKGKLLEQQRKVQYPQDPEDCFMSAGINPFSPVELKEHKKRLIELGNTGRKVFLTESETNGKIVEIDASSKLTPDFPFPGGFIDSPVVLYEALPDYEPSYGQYIAGLDDYKQDQSDTDSVGSFTIYKRTMINDEWSCRIVATYASRPDPHKKFWRQGHRLLKAFNAICFMENEDMGFKDYLDTKKVTDRYLIEGVDFASELDLNHNGRRAYGWNPTTKNINHMMGKLINYATEEIVVENKDGSKRTILGLERIPDIGILDEMINYKKGDNFDRLRSFGSALMYAEYLDATWHTPKPPKRKEEEEEKRRPKRRNEMFRKQSKRGFF